jgi:poly-gamma-glutamate system protein
VKPHPAGLVLTFVVAVAAWLAVQEYGRERVPHPRRDQLNRAMRRTERAFAVVDSAKRAEGCALPADSRLPWAALLGEDYTVMTTTLGSRQAKEVSTDPAWAAVIVRLLDRAGVGAGDTVAVLISSSFPALAVAALAGLHELGAVPLVMSSVGASSYGANVQGGTWLDWERWLRDAGVLPVRSALVTPGGEGDAAAGLPEEGRAWIETAARRNGVVLVRPTSLADAIAVRMSLLARVRPRAVINIGGGQASLGACRHAESLPVGRWQSTPACHCPDRGVLVRLSEQGVPVIHLLQIRQLASLYGLDPEPGGRPAGPGDVTLLTRLRSSWILAALSVIIVSLLTFGKRLT